MPKREIDADVIYTSISFTDLEQLGFTVDVRLEGESYQITRIRRNGKTVELGTLLWSCGIIDNMFVNVDKCEHLRVNGQRTINYRLTGEERFDDEWMKSGHASDERKLTSSSMGDMVHYAKTLRNGGDR